MSGKFIPASAVERETLDWGALGWVSRPPSTGAQQLTVAVFIPRNLVHASFNVGDGPAAPRPLHRLFRWCTLYPLNQFAFQHLPKK